MFLLVLLGSIIAIVLQTTLWRKFIYAYYEAFVYLLFRKIELLRLIFVMLFVLLGDYLVFSTFAFLSVRLSGFSYIAFYVLITVFWFFTYGGSISRRKKYLQTVDITSDSTYVASVKKSTTEFEFLMLDIEVFHVYAAVLFIVAIAIWPILGLWS